MKIDLKRNVALTASSEIAQICQPLNKFFGISYFNFVKIFEDGSRAVLSNKPDFIETYYKCKELYLTKAVLKMETIEEATYHLYSEFSDQPSFVVSRCEFNIDNGIILAQPMENAIELYYFATTRDDYKAVGKLLRNLDSLYRFILYFKEKAKKLIDEAVKQKFSIPLINQQTYIDRLNQSIEQKQRDQFLSETSITRFYSKSEEYYLTIREAECLKLLFRNFSAKEIASDLGISPRTAETHLNNIKGTWIN